ncbi:MAG: Hsp20/alpha crystallin family protein [Kiritimatiellales bacterium]|nr:Hsp20/alpha crystallin family protein [Kiritimatiellota bacterium]MBL7016839.1 Hsp20/alpha crystallin family protein [Kiritimatiellales bacterium]
MKNSLIPWKKQAPETGFEWSKNPFELLHREIDDLFNSALEIWPLNRRHATSDYGFELSETDDEIRVKAELPGMDEKDIQVLLEEDMLTIRGERHEQHEEKKRNVHISEMSHGSFHRSFPLRTAIDRDKLTAKFKRGVLTLTLPKTDQAKAESKRIPISTD